MDRYSLGITLHHSCIRICIFNVDRNEIVHAQKVSFDIEKGILHFLDIFDDLLKGLSQNPLMKQIAMFKVAGNSNIAVLCNQKFYKALMLYSGYTKSLREHFTDSFVSLDFLYPKANANFNKSVNKELVENYNLISDNALLYTLKDFCLNQPNEFAETQIIQSLGAFVTSLIAGKRAPVDSSFGISSGLSVDGLKWSEKNTQWVANDLKSKLDEIKASNDSFSYVGSYFVEKIGVYREARVLPAGSTTGTLARGAGGAVFLDTDDWFQLGVVVSEIPDSKDGYLLNGLGPGRFICLIKNDFHGLEPLLEKYNTNQFEEFNLEDIQLVTTKDILHLDYSKNQSYNVIVSYLLSFKQHARPFEKIYISGALSKSPFFMQLCADLFGCEVVVYNHSEFASAVGCALSGGRKIKECGYEEALQLFFKNVRFQSYFINESNCEFLLGLAMQYKSRL